jgi:DNA-binding MarR family transcriptional regulator
MKNAITTNRAEEILLAIRRLMQTGELYTKALDKKYGVSASQLNCIHALMENGAIPISRIAEYMMVKSSTVTGVLDRLEQKHLVQRERSDIDRRVINIRLTEAGQTLANKVPSSIDQRIVKGLNALSPDETDQIADALNKLTSMLYVEENETNLFDKQMPFEGNEYQSVKRGV